MTLTPERWHAMSSTRLCKWRKRIGLPSSTASAPANPSLRAELKQPVAAEAEIGSEFLEEPALAALRPDTASGHAVLPSGTQLGPYVVQSLIGVGDMGEVYCARAASLKRDVAIKIRPVSSLLLTSAFDLKTAGS